MLTTIIAPVCPQHGLAFGNLEMTAITQGYSRERKKEREGEWEGKGIVSEKKGERKMGGKMGSD